jgi:hypothetical protein
MRILHLITSTESGCLVLDFVLMRLLMRMIHLVASSRDGRLVLVLSPPGPIASSPGCNVLIFILTWMSRPPPPPALLDPYLAGSSSSSSSFAFGSLSSLMRLLMRMIHLVASSRDGRLVLVLSPPGSFSPLSVSLSSVTGYLETDKKNSCLMDCILTYRPKA